jgi:tetratricopeptide (TPR) repeat protein
MRVFEDDKKIKVRVERFIRFFDKHKELNRRKEQLCQYLIISLGAIIPIINVAEIDSRDETIFSNIGIVLNNLGNHTGAILYFDKALAIDPKTYQAFEKYNIGVKLATTAKQLQPMNIFKTFVETYSTHIIL